MKIEGILTWYLCLWVFDCSLRLVVAPELILPFLLFVFLLIAQVVVHFECCDVSDVFYLSPHSCPFAP